uniref:Uncharacterized protein n=1 Tax=Ascaris lumbricoides TaxID=6252 RepID=A0A0M3HHF6_ASCLU
MNCDRKVIASLCASKRRALVRFSSSFIMNRSIQVSI